MEWYKTLKIDQRINLKDLCPEICGAKFQPLIKLLGFRVTINAMYESLKNNGFDV